MSHPVEEIKKLVVLGAATKVEAGQAIHKTCQQMQELYRKTDKDICIDMSLDPHIEIDLNCDCSTPCSHMLDSWVMTISRRTFTVRVRTKKEQAYELKQVLEEFGMKLVPLVKLLGNSVFE